MADQKDQRYYVMTRLHAWFAVASILCLLSLVGLWAQDYLREWKVIQRAFRKLDVQKTREKYLADKAALGENPQYVEILKSLEAAAAELRQKSGALAAAGKNLAMARAENAKINQQYNFAKAEFEAARFRYESAKGHGHGDAAEAEKSLAAAQQKMADLKLKAEASDKKREENEKAVDAFGESIEMLEKERYGLDKQVSLAYRNLQKLDAGEMTLPNKLGNLVRDMPVMDMFAPYYKIEQAVIRGLTDDVNFMRVPKVDRCVTCHLGVQKAGFEDAPSPFKTHPRLDLFLSSNSAHPFEDFGCAGCHGGRGRGTDFNGTVHMPQSPEQARAWEKAHGWNHFQLWETPMFPLKYAQAGCFQCHSKETHIQGAEKLDLGLAMIEQAGCYGCHDIELFNGRPKKGPSLRHVTAKTSPEWLFRWIKAPENFKPHSWMPSFFGQSNNADEASRARADQEIHAIVAYLTKKSEAYTLEPVSSRGDPVRGKALVSSVGCLGCHSENLSEEPVTLETLRREHGPMLTGLGSKTSEKWLYQWVKAPEKYSPGTKMPNLRLTDQEASDIAAYLAAGKNAAFGRDPIPAVDPALTDEIAFTFLAKLMPETDARAKIAALSGDEKLLYNGERLIKHYGCFGCHDIPGLEKEKPIGTPLTEEGSKSPHLLDFGFIHLEHANHAWFEQKLKDPRIFDRDRVKAPDEKLRMPNFRLSEERVEAIVTAILGFVKKDPENKLNKPRTPRNQFVEEGQALVSVLNCKGCHQVEGDGGAIRPTVKSWLVAAQGRDEADADAVTPSFSPPNLIGEGKKVQTDWLYHFLRKPEPIRPWLKVRMPTFNITDAEANTLIRYFSYLDRQDFPFVHKMTPPASGEKYAAGQKLFSKQYLSCGECHIQGAKMPPGSPEKWAPDFALTKDRLKPEWIVEWLKDPQKLLPGTKMPTFFDPQYFDQSGPEDILGGDELKQIGALRDYLLTIR